MVTASELAMNKTASAVDMANAIFGTGVTVTGASYSGSSYSSATYSGGNTTSPGVVPGDTGVILSTGSVDNFTRGSGDPNRSTGISVNSGGANNQADFNAIAGARTYDAAYLEVDFIPDTNVMTLQFVFSSDEYPEYSNSVYNDVVGVWANGTHVPLSISNSAASVGAVNQTNNINLFRSNSGDDYNTEMDGFTLTMTLTIPVVAGAVNTLKIGIADVADNRYDSNLLIAGDSLQTALVAQQDDVTILEGQTQTVDVLGNDINGTAGTLVITHINGVAVQAGDSVTLQTGQVVTLNSDGTLDIQTDTDNDTISFTYDVGAVTGGASNGGNTSVLETDTGFVTVTTIPCFVAGTLIRTPEGEMPVEMLAPGNLVETLDHGPQPLRWIGQRTVAAQGAMAPVQIRRGTFGNHEALMLSPQHRVLVQDPRAEMFFGEDQVLVAARDLIDGRAVRQVTGGEVTYVHLLFDRHQIIWSGGLATESFLPGPQTTALFDAPVVAEICALFPELEPRTGAGYSPAARRTLRKFEAQLLMRGAA